MRKSKIVLYAVFIALFLGAISIGLWYYFKMKQPTIDAFGTIPNNAAFVLKLNESTKSWEQLKKEGGILDKLSKQNFLPNFIQSTDSVLLEFEKFSTIKNFIHQNPVFISFHFAGSDNFDVLYTFSINPPFELENIQSDISKIGNLTDRTFKGVKIYCVITKQLQKYYFTFNGGVLSLSMSDLLIEKVILNIQNPQQNSAESLLNAKMLKMGGNDALANIYLNYRYAYRFLSKYANVDLIDFVSQVGAISEKASLDVAVTDNMVMLNGFSFSYDSIPTFMRALRTQSPKQISSYNILPKDICFMSTFTFDDFEELNKSLKENNFGLQNDEAIAQFSKAYNVNLSDYFFSWMNSELTLAVNKTNYENLENNTFCVLKATDIKEAENKLVELGKLISTTKVIADDMVNYREFVIRNLHQDYVIPNLFGSFFNPIKNSYYVAIQNYIVFCSNTESLKLYIDEILLENTLAENPIFSKFAENLSEKANYSMYSNLSLSSEILKYFVNPEVAQQIQDNQLPINCFDGYAFQLICEEEGDYTNFLLSYKSNEEKVNSYDWQVSLDDEIVGEVYSFEIKSANTTKIVAFDKQKNIYQIDNSGRVDWKIPVAELPLGKVYLVDYFKNGKFQYLFNSSHYLYLIDMEGNRVDKFPMKLPMIATGGLFLFDFDNNLNYKLLFPFEDKKIHCLGLDGKESKEWTKPIMKNNSIADILFFKSGKEENLILSDTMGNVQFLRRNGSLKNQAGTLFTKNNWSAIFDEMIDKRYFIISSDKIGRVVLIDSKGKVEKKSLLDLKMEHIFYLSDINSDGKKEYVFVTSQKLLAFNNSGEQIEEFSFENEIDLKTFSIVNFDIKKVLFAAKIVKDGSIKIYKNTGELIENQINIVGKNFYFIQATLTNEMHLMTADGRVINSYQIKE